MTQHRPVHVGVFRRIQKADEAVEELRAAGFPASSISVICPTCAEDDLTPYVRTEPSGEHTRDAALTGGAILGVLGGLAGAVGVVASGGTGLLAVGPILGAAGGGSIVGGFLGAMTTRGVEPEIADYYDQALSEGKILVAVESDAGQATSHAAERAFERVGAESFDLPRG